MTNSSTLPHPTEITVNGGRVEIVGAHPTGHHIKVSAIEQGLSIRLGWILKRIAPDGEHPVGDEEHIHLEAGISFKASPQEVEILVNDHLVLMPDDEAKGLEIKQAAIQKGIPIQLDFVLSAELGPKRTKVVGDEDLVHLHKHERFVAVAPDDNSGGSR